MDADRGWCGGAGGCGHQLAGGLRVGGATQGLRGDAGAACVPDRAALDILSRPASTAGTGRSEEHTSELQSLMRISYAVFCLKKKQKTTQTRKRTETLKKK